MHEFARFLAPDRSALDWLRRHGAFWLVFVSLLGASWRYWSGSWADVLRCIIPLVGFEYLPMTYLLLYGVLPRLLRGQARAFGLGVVGWLAAFLLLRLGLLQSNLVPFIDQAPTLPADRWRHLFDASFMVTNSLVVAAASLKVFRYQYQQEQLNQELAQHTLAAELQLLKAQVQPHFLFNTLNTIYSLTLRQSAQASHAVRQLAGLLRQVTSSADILAVPLTQEIDLLRNYLILEELRYGARLTVDLRVTGKLVGQQLAPLLLLPFLENAFKHGAAAQTGPVRLELHLHATATTLHFYLRNTCDPASPALNSQPGGLGLPNVRQRLALLYPGCHRLHLRPTPTHYTVELTLPLEMVPARVTGPVRGKYPRPLLATS
ncbi:hypothetical protein FNT36_16815 [Hymenobacter setariae]|uniref:Signal transduction histidine kinase internal region domain-containing protein n=1 Tax=Hymenobacter setariae TaxID=2594794 RepID=A0A558BS19_9BACT|nr:sensor histidine kinase [Hymenobacter setariae]TVT39317.1 hypothetical protein FNT36_16815 [Hymenobacter setariae]